MFVLTHSVEDGFTFSMKNRPLLWASDFDITNAALSFIEIMNNALLTNKEDDAWNEFMNNAIAAVLIDSADIKE